MVYYEYLFLLPWLVIAYLVVTNLACYFKRLNKLINTIIECLVVEGPSWYDGICNYCCKSGFDKEDVSHVLYKLYKAQVILISKDGKYELS